jgi:hypothetical protein
MREQGVHYKFLLNGPLPVGYTLQEDEDYYEDLTMSPGMFRKFVRGCEALTKHYDFILRLNASTFVDFHKMPAILACIPRRDRIIAGYPMEFYHKSDGYFIHGSAMLFSRDCIDFILANTSDPCIYKTDDYALTEIALRYCERSINLLDYFLFLTHNACTYDIIKEHTVFFRIKNPDREEYDLRIWEDLYTMFL